MDLANMRQNAVRSLDVMCHGCRHEVILNVDQYPGDLLVREFGPRMVCTKCGMVGADVGRMGQSGSNDEARRG